MENDNKLVTVVTETGLLNPQAEFIISKFKPLFESAKALIVESQDIVVSDVSEVELMKKARANRLALKEIRVNAGKTKTELKEDVLKYGKAVQGVFNLIEEAISPVEEHLEKQENFAKIIEEEKAKAIKAQRIQEISQYVEDYSIYNFDSMSDEAFNALVASVKRDFDEKKEKERVAEETRLAELKKKEEEDEKMRIENSRLKKEKEEKEKKDEEDRLKREAEQKKKDEEHQAELKKIEDEKKRLQKEMDDKAEEDRLKREAEEQKEKERIAAEKKAEEDRIESARQAELAPEKDKLTAYAEAIRTIKSPDGLSKAGLEVVKIAEEKLLEISQEIKLKVKEL